MTDDDDRWTKLTLEVYQYRLILVLCGASITSQQWTTTPRKLVYGTYTHRGSACCERTTTVVLKRSEAAFHHRPGLGEEEDEDEDEAELERLSFAQR